MIQVSLSIDPVTVYEAIDSFLKHVVEIILASLLPFDAVQVVIQLVHVADTSKLINQSIDILVLVVHVADEFAIRCIVLWLLFIFERLGRVHIATVDFFWLSFGFIHANLIDPAAEGFAPLRKLLVEVAREEDLSVVSVAEFVDTERYLGVLT